MLILDMMLDFLQAHDIFFTDTLKSIESDFSKTR